jgi:hypothetical protein
LKEGMTMEETTITINLPRDVYDRVAEILSGQGLTVEDAIVLFIKETVRLGRIPFDYTEEDLEEVRRWEEMINDELHNV